MQRVVMFSGGIGSWGAARRVADQYGTDGLVLLFTDTLIEDADLYRFLDDAAEDIGVPVTRIADGRTPWEVFADVKFLGNSRVDPCSRVLKRDLADAWLAERYQPENVVVYVGIDWTEVHRFDRMRDRPGGKTETSRRRRDAIEPGPGSGAPAVRGKSKRREPGAGAGFASRRPEGEPRVETTDAPG